MNDPGQRVNTLSMTFDVDAHVEESVDTWKHLDENSHGGGRFRLPSKANRRCWDKMRSG